MRDPFVIGWLVGAITAQIIMLLMGLNLEARIFGGVFSLSILIAYSGFISWRKRRKAGE